MNPLYIRMHERDNVAIVANHGGLAAGTTLPSGLRLVDRVPQGHKVALADIAAEFRAVRDSTLALFHGLDADAWPRVGTASGHPISARALAWIISGHEAHHLRVLVERYLPHLGS